MGADGSAAGPRSTNGTKSSCSDGRDRNRSESDSAEKAERADTINSTKFLKIWIEVEDDGKNRATG